MTAVKKITMSSAIRLAGVVPIILASSGRVEGGDQPAVHVSAFARLEHDRVRETSGVVASRKQPGVFWTHGDSGNEPKIVAFDRTGRILAEVHIDDAPNLDWEDIAADNEGHIYIGDIGDGGHYAVRHIYKIAEPDPQKPPVDAVKPIETIAFRYPNDKGFDIEALFVVDGQMYVIGKSKLPGARLYRVEEAQDESARLNKIGVLPGYLVTAADASPDGKQLILASYYDMQILDVSDPDAIEKATLHRSVSYQCKGRIEGCCFDGDNIVLMSEDGRAFRMKAADLTTCQRFLLE